ncbi:hypothetical protein ACHAXT_011026 [Thalassiosira profunda]
MVNLRGSKLLRLGSSGSSPKRSPNAERRYPEHIICRDIDAHSDSSDDNGFRRRHEREELKVWKRKARALEEANKKLEGAVEGLREKVASLERAARMHDLEEEDVAMGERSADTDSPASSRSSTPVEDDKKEGEGQRQRRDRMVRQLVGEMERLMDRRMNDPDGRAQSRDASSPPSNDGTQGGTGSSAKIGTDTFTLAVLVSKLLKEEKHDAKRRAKKKSDKQKEKQKDKCRDLYQLTCRNCIGCNYVSACKKDELKERVKENYAIVWQVVQLAYGKGDGADVEIDHGPHSLSFRASSFAHHVAEHCKDCNSEEEVYEWCLENVRVERISKHPFM